MSEHRIFATKFSSVYPLFVQKAARKGRTQDEVDRVICWLMRKIRYLDKLVDELAKGKPIEKVLR